MKTLRAAFAGVAGALAMSLAMFVLRSSGVNVGLEALLGTVVDAPVGLDPWTIGFVIHLSIGAIAGLMYAVIFEMAVQRAGLLVGAGLGLCHGLLAGLMMSGIPAMNPLTEMDRSVPGAFLQNVSFGPFIFVLLHILFGVTVGVVYGRPVQHVHQYTNRTV